MKEKIRNFLKELWGPLLFATAFVGGLFGFVGLIAKATGQL